MSEAPLMPDERGEPPAAAPPPDRAALSGAGDVAAPAAERHSFARFAAGLSRQHGWRLVAFRLVVFAILLGALLYVLAVFVRSQ
jgi:hypothetical protein